MLDLLLAWLALDQFRVHVWWYRIDWRYIRLTVSSALWWNGHYAWSMGRWWLGRGLDGSSAAVIVSGIYIGEMWMWYSRVMHVDLSDLWRICSSFLWTLQTMRNGDRCTGTARWSSQLQRRTCAKCFIMINHFFMFCSDKQWWSVEESEFERKMLLDRNGFEGVSLCGFRRETNQITGN